ncbi:SDR family NAD(P)-dependent oxidoreductase [Halorarius litoreus]|uniref:SDR family NAD(P)-dependent oxidoreductase n=1 Tax=Halorarius litoreus TaxID=2962676 RepID=UPI0020CBE32F|nr:SDR family NAD(P)-dependent oxidoreductase [Halorarius litoreus]
MLEDTVCIVCGAGGGLGEETAVAMADHGASVVVNDLGVDVSGEGSDAEPAEETVERIEDAGGEAMAHFGDVTDLDYTERLVRETVDEYGAVHTVVNFAGILRDSMVFNMDEAEWDAVVDVHLKGHFSLLRNVSAHWRERYKQEGFDRQRSFVCVSSGVAAGNPGQANYSAAKAGTLGLMRTGARELHQYDVRVNAMWPTALTRMTEDLPAMAGADPESMGPQFAPAVPVFLASDAAEDVTGCTLGIVGDNVAFVSDPERERSLAAEGEMWTAEALADRWDELSEGFETTKLAPGW